MSKVNHWGIEVDSDEPTTGVVFNGNVEWLQEELFYGSGIDISYEATVEELQSEGMSEEEIEEVMEHHESADSTFLIGSWRKTEEGFYEPDKTSTDPEAYAAIVNSIYTQVVWSNTVQAGCKLCSPCYPGQADLDTTGGKFKAYALPKSLMGDIGE